MERMSKGKLFQTVGPVKEERPFSESLSVCSWYTKRKATVTVAVFVTFLFK